MNDILTSDENRIGEAARAQSRVRMAIRFLQNNYQDQPSLDAVADSVGLSPHHFQREFTRHVGISPKKFVQHLSLERAKHSLSQNGTILDATFDAGLSGPGRLHDLFVTHEAVTPGEWKSRALGLQLRYGWHDSPFGDCLIIASERGVCGLGFADDGGHDAALAELWAQLDQADIAEDRAATARHADVAFGGAAGNLHLVLRGTPFQIQVWRALLRIPPGGVASYSQVANAIGKPSARRAVGQACGANPVPWLIPCHRVLRSDGQIWNYRWGDQRKQMMLAWESAKAEELAATA